MMNMQNKQESEHKFEKVGTLDAILINYIFFFSKSVILHWLSNTDFSCDVSFTSV